MNTLTSHLQLLFRQDSLTKEETKEALEIILQGADPHQTAAFLVLLKQRGETVDEIAGMLEALEEKALRVHLPYPVLDIVGTGGDLSGTVNISTGSAILAAACGIPIAKHGNRSVSSRSGSADVLEALGINISTSPELLAATLQYVGIAFMFAPLYHPSLKELSSVRQGLKIPTILNLLGPLLNPAQAEYSLIGVANPSIIDTFCQLLLRMSHKKRTLLFHGNGLDELSPLGLSTAYEICAGNVIPHEIDPRSLGLSLCRLEDLQGGDAKTNAAILKEAFAGNLTPVANALILNAGAALWIFGEAPTLKSGVEIARETLKQGKALQVLETWISFSNNGDSKSNHRASVQRDDHVTA